MRRSAVSAGLLALCVAVITLAQPIRPLSGMGTTSTASLNAVCRPRVAMVGRPTIHGSNVTLASDGLLAIHVCSRGTLKFQLSSTDVHGIGANAVVMVGNQMVLSSYVSGERSVTAHVTRGDWIEIGFSNDLYVGRSQDRNLLVSQLAFNGKPILLRWTRR